ncbi:phage recombination protein Bet [Streptantibioticus ferralitis]|uniref:Phage recombination protein Bet n=1 Tax=Streptantibioticus ferralitis TaxID=236510 RepID=A0ABT5Z0D4_9ACTN|nr:phage recombination protein Bet [Streptantibioticus ferralitis]MDF2257169.1 phage recombination protein Bet [Streptantibioticus ferralitis]
MNDQQPDQTTPVEGTVVATAPRPIPASAIVLRADQEEFDRRQLSALALVSPGLENAPRAQLAMFFHYCVRTGLDPFARQIYMIGRKNWKAADDPDAPEMTWTIQTGIDGFRTVAHRAAERTGERISYEDTVYYDAEGAAHEVWLAQGPPAAVKVTVLRGESRFPMIARWGEFAPTYWDAKKGQYVVAKMWRQMPAHMLRKCAEAGSLRMAAPQDLSGVYADEEMEQADAEATAGVAEDAARRLRAAAGLETGQQASPKPDAQQEAPDEPTPAARSRKKAAAKAPAAPQQAEDAAKPARRRATGKKTAAAKPSSAASTNQEEA